MTRVGLDETIQQQHQQHQQPMFDMMLGVQHQSQQQQQQQQQQQFAAAAAAQRGNVIVANEEAKASSKAAKRKTYGQTVPQFGAQSASVARRNARERNRVKQVNQGFDVLRQHIPLSLIQALGDSSPAASPGNCSPASSSSGGGGGGGSSRAGNKKPSKVETLRLALVYIESLRAQLQEDDEQSGSGGVDRLEDADDQPSYYQPHQDQQQSPIYAPAPCSEASSSPTPSFESDASPAPTSHGYETNFATGMYALAPADPYANYDASFSPDDLVQYISLAWQQH